MAYPQGINFRATSGYVTDGTGEDYEIATTLNYPRTSAQGNSVGWEANSGGMQDTRDRNASNDRRLAGFGFTDSPNFYMDYRMDLPSSGTYDVRVAMGDNNNSAPGQKFGIYDTTTLLGSDVTTNTTAANSFCDATGTEYTAANWPGSNSSISKTFSTTIFRIRFTGTGGNTFRAAHVNVAAAASGGLPFFMQTDLMTGQMQALTGTFQ